MSTFSSLLASANAMQYTGLTSTQTSSGLPSSTLHRTLDELANNEAYNAEQNMDSAPLQREANQLLAKFFDPQAFETSVMDLEFSRTSSSVPYNDISASLGSGVQGDDLKSYLRNHHDKIVGTAVSDTQAKTLKDATELMQKRRVEDWSEEKMRLLHDLAGRRSGKWMPTNNPSSSSVNSTQMQHQAIGNGNSFSNSFEYSNNSNYSMISNNNPNISHLSNNPSTTPLTTTSNDPSSFYTQNNTNASLDNALLNAGGLFSPPHKSSSSVSFISPLGSMATLNTTAKTNKAGQHAFTPNNEAWGGGSQLTESARRHANMVARINQSRYTGTPLIPTSTQPNWQTPSAPGAMDPGSADPASSEFAAMTSLLVPPNAHTSNSITLTAYPSAYNLLSYMLSNKSDGDLQHKCSQRAMGSLECLGEQYKVHVKRRVRQAALSGRNVEGKGQGTGIVQDIEAFVKLEGDGNIEGNGRVFWCRFYFALRCFDYGAAMETLQMGGGGEVEIEQNVLLLTTLLAQAQETSKVADVGYLKKTRDNVTEVYHRTKAREGSGGEVKDNYKVAAMNLLSLSDPSTGSEGVIGTIEDYLFAAMWDATEGGFGATSKTPDAVQKLGDLLTYWGPAHFQKDSNSDSWAYAYPLLVAQQWEKALTHLAENSNSGLLEATHLAIVLSVSRVFGVSNSTGNKLLTSLLVSYSTSIQNRDPEAALEYLVLLPGDAESIRMQVKRLLLQTGAYSILAGVVAPDGSRVGGGGGRGGNGGALDAHFGAAEVNRLLYECGEELVREGGGAGIGGAAELFSLAGQYGALLSLLNGELATRLNAWEGGVESEGRKFWKNAAVNFQQAHLAHGRTHVIEVLEQEGSLAIGETFQLLLNLMTFFDKFRQGEFEGAWALLDMLNLLPRAEGELPIRVESFHSNLDNVVKTHFPQIVLTGMECLFHQHTAIKQSIRGAGGPGGTQGGAALQGAAVSSMEQRLVEIRERARLLVTYTGLLHHKMPGDANAQIARMEAYMM